MRNLDRQVQVKIDTQKYRIIINCYLLQPLSEQLANKFINLNQAAQFESTGLSKQEIDSQVQFVIYSFTLINQNQFKAQTKFAFIQLSMFKNRVKSKQMRPQSAKFDINHRNRPYKLKVQQRFENSPIRPSSHDYFTSLNRNKPHKNYQPPRNDLSNEKPKKKIKKTVQTKSNDFLLNTFDHQGIEEEAYLRQKQNLQKSKTKDEPTNKKKTSIGLRSVKDTVHIKSLNRQKQKNQTKQVKTKQVKVKSVSFKAFIGTKLRKNLESYLLFINLINYSIRIRYKAFQSKKYTVYVGKGNNSKLVKKLFKNRFWWKIAKKETDKEINLVWSQWSKPDVFYGIKKTTKLQNIQKCDESPVIQEQIAVSSKPKTIRTKEDFVKKLQNQNLHELQHIYDLMEDIDKNKLFRKAIKHDLKYEYLKDLVSKQNNRTHTKMKVSLTHNHIENHQQLTNKKNLFFNLKNDLKHDVFSIVPLTFHVSTLQQGTFTEENSLDSVLNLISQYVNRTEQRKDKSVLWIVKPGENSNRGCGIQVFKKSGHIRAHIQRQMQKHPERTFIVQKYIQPFLYHRRKFDIRCYLLLTATPEIKAYYYPIGYIRTSSCEFTNKNCSNKFIHLTNDAVQKKQQEYGKYQKGNKVTYSEFQNYLDSFESKKQLSFFKQIIPQIRQTMIKTVKAMVQNYENEGQKKLNPQKRMHSFELYGFDFMIDESFYPWLIQVNTNPCMETGCEILQDIIPSLLQNAIKICVDTVFPPPKLEDWPLNQVLTCPEQLFQPNLFELVYSQNKN